MSTLLLLVALIQSGIDPVATPTEGSAMPQIKGADLGLLREVRTIAATVAKLRGQPFERPALAVRVQAPMVEVADEIRALSVLPSARLEARGRAWADVGLGSAATPLRLMRTLASDLDGVSFDPGANRLLFGPDLLSASDFEPSQEVDDPATLLLMTGVRPDEPVIAHLLLHVRQRERSGRDLLEPTTDRLLAGAAWAEGEANLVAIRFLFDGLGLADDILKHRIDPASVLDGRLLPSGLGELSPTESALVEFVYLDGFDQAMRHFRRGGWPALDTAMAARRTTLDLMNPDRDPLGQPSYAEAPRAPFGGLRLADEDSLGERGIAVLISLATGKDNLGMMVGQGWRGDRLLRWESAEGGTRGVTHWITEWDSESSARVFDQAYARSLGPRFPGATLEGEETGPRRLAAGASVITLEKRGRQVHVRVHPSDWSDRFSSAE